MDGLFAFVLMPFDQQYDDLYRFGIKEPAAELSIVAERVDEQIYSEGILERIYRQIDSADIVIADMSGQNPNVFYEVGYAHAKGKMCILLTSQASDIPFDLKHRRHIVYEHSIKELRRRILDELAWAKKQIEDAKASRISLVVKDIFGDLEKNSYSAIGNLHFMIDMLNEAVKPSADIEAIYVYSGKGWRFYQDGRECPSTGSDIANFAQRHFLTAPLRRLQKGAWAQLKFSAKKTLAWATKGERLKDSYRVYGKAILKLITPEGDFDYELMIDTTADDIPF